jgi:hypothetical protein
MTNEELIEEIYYEAHTEGFIGELNDLIREFGFTHPKLTHHERVEKAYNQIKKS